MSIPHDRSFASYVFSKTCWSSKNKISSTLVKKRSTDTYYFYCEDCKHHTENTPKNISSNLKKVACSICSHSKLCNDMSCKFCEDNSFKSSPFNKNFNNRNVDKNGIKIDTRTLFIRCRSKYWFDCECGHEIELLLCDIPKKATKLPCCYCGKKKLCDNQLCKKCKINSFASSPFSVNFSEKNIDENGIKINFLELFLKSDNKYLFNCNCKHSFELVPHDIPTVGDKLPCPYCSHKKLCDNSFCESCKINSFESSVFNKNFSDRNIDENGEKINARNIFLQSNSKYWFNCECGHQVEITISDISKDAVKLPCSYCSHKKLCSKDLKCNECFKNTFAVHPMSICWSEDNKDENGNFIGPDEVFRNSHSKYFFNCNECKNKFLIRLNDICFGKGCSHCYNKTELKLYNFLIVIYNYLRKQFEVDWCKNIKYLPFDFLLEDLKIIIELDGRQHFIQVGNWKCPKETQKNDKYKMKYANENGYSVIRLLQEDVWNDKNNWDTLLLTAIDKIKNDEIIQNIFISEGDKNIYDNHQN